MHHINESFLYPIFNETAHKLKIDHPKKIVYHTYHQNEIPTCLMCGGNVDWTGETPNPYRSYCGNKCRGKAAIENQRKHNLATYGVEYHTQRNDVKEKAKETNIEKYGVENPAQSSEIQKKIANTNLKKYGSERPLQNANVKKKMTETNLQRYGTEWTLQNSQVKQKAIETTVERYGVKTPLENKDILLKSMNTCFKNYGVNNPCKLDQLRNQMITTNIERYGFNSPTQNKEIFGKVQATNLERYGTIHASQAHFSKELFEILSDKEEFARLVNEIGVQKIAEKFSISSTTIYKYCNDYGIVLTNGNVSRFEKEIFDFVTDHYSDTIISSDRKILNGKELDIFLPGINLAIECNGTYWHSEMAGRGKDYHINKTNECNAIEISLFHIWQHDWYAKQDIVKSMLLHRFGKSHRIFARNTSIRAISNDAATKFYNENHLQGAATGIRISYGLYSNEQLVSIMSFGKSRFNKKFEWEILRFANILNHSVVGGASKLFNYFIKKHSPNSIISYSAKGHTTGNVYLQLGMKYSNTSSPGYNYTKNFIDIHSRQKFQKHKLKNLLEFFDPNMTEYQNMEMNGYTKLWDSGNDVYVWKKL